MADPAISSVHGSLAPVATGGSWLTRLRDRISPDLPYDGAFVGERNGAPAAFSGANDPDAVPPVMPDPGSYGAQHREAPGDIIFVNGIDTPWRSGYADAKRIADQTGQPVLNVHVATSAIANVGATGFPIDGIDTLANLGGFAMGHAPDTLATTIADRLERGEPVHVIAHSKGAIVTAEGLREASLRLEHDGASPAQARALLAKVQVETFGGAEPSFPDGPQYVHYVNRDDPVPSLLGLGKPGGHPGAGATTLFYDDNRFGLHDLDPAANHHLADAYLNDERVPFALARTLGPNEPDAIVRYVDDVAKRPNAHPQPLVDGP